MSIYDIGDDVVAESRTYVDGVLTDPATISIAVTAPDGTATAPSITNESTGVNVATIPTDQAGLWRYAFTTTGPVDVQHGSFTVAVDPGSGRLEPIATIADVEFYLGRDLTETERLRAPGLLASSATKIRAECRGQKLVRIDNDVVVLAPQGSSIILPQRPVIDVTAVAALGREGGADIPLTGWSFDGLETIRLTQATADNPNPLSWWENIARHVNRYRVTYSHGYDVMPETLVEISAQTVIRVLKVGAPEGVTQRTIGQYTEQFQQAAGAPGNSTWLTKAEKQQIRDEGFRRKAGSIPLRRR